MLIEELPGLSGDPPYPVQIALPGVSTFREGYVLRLHPEVGEAWVGNFQTGISYYSTFLDLHTDRAAVVAGGQGYVVDARRRTCQHTFGGDIMCLLPVKGTSDFLLISNTDLGRHCPTGLVWRSERVAWDGIGRVKMQGTELLGKARHFDDSWHEFQLNLLNGKHSGGAYPGGA